MEASIFENTSYTTWRSVSQGLLRSSLQINTMIYKDDHLIDYVSKNGRFTKYFAHPMEPTKIDDETYSEFREKMNEISDRQKYI